MPTVYPPYVIERSSRGERTYDIFSRLLMDRIVFLGTPIDDDVANPVMAKEGQTVGDQRASPDLDQGLRSIERPRSQPRPEPRGQ